MSFIVMAPSIQSISVLCAFSYCFCNFHFFLYVIMFTVHMRKIGCFQHRITSASSIINISRTAKERERERESERERERQIDTRTDGQRDRRTNEHTNGQTDGHIERETDSQNKKDAFWIRPRALTARVSVRTSQLRFASRQIISEKRFEFAVCTAFI